MGHVWRRGRGGGGKNDRQINDNTPVPQHCAQSRTIAFRSLRAGICCVTYNKAKLGIGCEWWEWVGADVDHTSQILWSTIVYYCRVTVVSWFMAVTVRLRG